ncbi:MAG: hypothetical protein ACOYXT_24775 [Bacteroidota bacterium]
MSRAALLDTSFFLRFLNASDPLNKNSDDYFRYFLDKDIKMIISTISVAEYCVGGGIDELPLKNLQILAFNLDHAKKAGEFAKCIFANRGSLKIQQRNIIPNDAKLFAQADVQPSIDYYVSSDTESSKIFELLKKKV